MEKRQSYALALTFGLCAVVVAAALALTGNARALHSNRELVTIGARVGHGTELNSSWRTERVKVGSDAQAGPEETPRRINPHAAVPLGIPGSRATLSVSLSYEEYFNVDPPAGWEPFTNYPGLDPNRWWAVSGVYNYQWDRFEPEYQYWDLTIFEGLGTELWTDYRIQARVKDVKDSNFRIGMPCIWFRGEYQDSGAMDGRHVGGYYLCMRPFASDPQYMDRLFLMRIPKDNPAFDAATTVASYHYEKGIGRKKWYEVEIDVRGSRIRVWFGRPEDGGLVKALDWTDTFTTGAWLTGTVGFAAYDTTARYDYIRVLSQTAVIPVRADFSAAPTSGVAPLKVDFTNKAQGDYTVSLWDFGDGITSTLESPTHTYTLTGSFSVSLTVSGPGGTASVSREGYIKVADKYRVYLPAVARERN